MATPWSAAPCFALVPVAPPRRAWPICCALPRLVPCYARATCASCAAHHGGRASHDSQSGAPPSICPRAPSDAWARGSAAFATREPRAPRAHLGARPPVTTRHRVASMCRLHRLPAYRYAIDRHPKHSVSGSASTLGRQHPRRPWPGFAPRSGPRVPATAGWRGQPHGPPSPPAPVSRNKCPIHLKGIQIDTKG